MKRLAIIILLMAIQLAYGAIIVNPHRFSVVVPPAAPAPHQGPIQYQADNEYINVVSSVQFQTLGGYQNMVVSLASQYQAGAEFVNKNGAVQYQTIEGFQN